MNPAKADFQVCPKCQRKFLSREATSHCRDCAVWATEKPTEHRLLGITRQGADWVTLLRLQPRFLVGKPVVQFRIPLDCPYGALQGVFGRPETIGRGTPDEAYSWALLLDFVGDSQPRYFTVGSHEHSRRRKSHLWRVDYDGSAKTRSMVLAICNSVIRKEI